MPDPVREAIQLLARRLPKDTDTRVVLDFLEDDLREGLSAIADVEAHFTDVLDALRAEDSSAQELLATAEDLEVLRRLEYLLTVAAQLRRRVHQAARRLTTSATTSGPRRGRVSRPAG
ncbi:MAG TPA: hypothetical protein VND93_28000 [Myxococcales bacterium]|nr:hypothetical protein [Myxococcales bacterium]